MTPKRSSIILLVRIVLLLIVAGGVAAKVIGKTSEPKSYEVDETIVTLRELLYADASLDQTLTMFQPDETEFAPEVMAALQANDPVAAETALAKFNNFDDFSRTLFYWLAMAKTRQMQGDMSAAQTAALQILKMPELEARIQIQTWSILRELGYSPNENEAEKVLGVVAEMGFDEGAAIIAGFADGEARMFLTSGGGIIGEMRDEGVITAAKALVERAENLTPLLPLETERPLPAPDRIRLVLLTPAGMRAVDEAVQDIENPGHELHSVYIAMHELLSNLIRLYESGEG